MLRDVLVGEIPTVLRGGLYAIPALVGAGIVVVAYNAGDHTLIFPIVGAAGCFLMRMAGLRYDIGLPRADTVAVTRVPRLRRNHAVEHDGDSRQHQPPTDDAAGDQLSTAETPKG